MTGRLKNSPILSISMGTITGASEGLAHEGNRFQRTFEVALDKIKPDPDQPRKHFDEGSLKDLAASIQELGLLQPIVVRPDPEQSRSYIIVYGERRWQAAKLVGLTEILVMESNGNHEEKALAENMQRVDLNPIEEARGIRRLMKNREFTHERCAAVLGINRVKVTELVSILDLPTEFLDKVACGEADVSESIMIGLARLPDGDVRARLLDLALEGNLTVKMLRQVKNSAGASRPRQPQAEKPVGFEKGHLDRTLDGVISLRTSTYRPTPREVEILKKIRDEIILVVGEV